MFTKDLFDITPVEECLDVFVVESTLGKFLTCLLIERRSMRSRENGPLVIRRSLDCSMAIECAVSLSWELSVLPFLGFSEDAQRASLKIDIAPEEALSSVVAGITSDFSGTTA
ncbi:hypothetical protein [Halococcus salifodinae]|uniref:hypothetical protein n=1 Tax=Halococcus salifodinae TaxID=36738 RepID=UPI00067819B3|nr:hypothetical protein [Halococcus salifodinae]